MAGDPDEDRIQRKAHELWEADGRRHGRDADHWVQAKEIIAIEDSQGDTLLPRDTGVQEPVEDADEALRNLADFPNLTDQGENLLTSTDREPSFGGDGGMPAVEVPTSDQPGIPAKPRSAASKPDRDMAASPKNNAPAPSRAEPKSTPVKTASPARSPAKSGSTLPKPGGGQKPTSKKT